MASVNTQPCLRQLLQCCSFLLQPDDELTHNVKDPLLWIYKNKQRSLNIRKPTREAMAVPASSLARAHQINQMLLLKLAWNWQLLKFGKKIQILWTGLWEGSLLLFPWVSSKEWTKNEREGTVRPGDEQRSPSIAVTTQNPLGAFPKAWPAPAVATQNSLGAFTSGTASSCSRTMQGLQHPGVPRHYSGVLVHF